MGSVYESIMAGLNEAVEDAKSKESKLTQSDSYSGKRISGRGG